MPRSSNRKYLLIVNPEAGSRRTMAALPEIDRILRGQKVQFEFHFTDRRGHATELVQELGDRFDTIVSVGGDGTINEIINGMPNLDKPLAIIPIGTGNDFARSCCIPHDNVSKSLEILLQEDIKQLDVGLVNDRRFINAMGLGYEGQVNAIGHKLGMIKGALKYNTAIAVVFCTYRRVPVKFRCAEFNHEGLLFLASIGNGWNVGGGIKLTPKAQLDDGKLDICYIKNISRMKIATNINRLKNGTLINLPEVEYFQTNELEIESSSPLAVHIDGEQFEPIPNKLKVSILPKAQKIIGNWAADTRF